MGTGRPFCCIGLESFSVGYRCQVFYRVVVFDQILIFANNCFASFVVVLFSDNVSVLVTGKHISNKSSHLSANNA